MCFVNVINKKKIHVGKILILKKKKDNFRLKFQKGGVCMYMHGE